MTAYELKLGNCLDNLRLLPADSIDSIITDPPYGISFMGKKWDYDVPSIEIWIECLRVLKPGGHLLSFASTRTQHRMAIKIEDAGFEIRDMIAWIYGGGFPKSRNISGDMNNSVWEGWGTALKPALDPITVARKPLIDTVAKNVLKYGTGALNIDACRVNTENIQTSTQKGRWPANLIHDGEDVISYFPQAKGQQGKVTGTEPSNKTLNTYGEFSSRSPSNPRKDTGSAARFFYAAKVSKKDRDEDNTHPTVKPTDLMRYLCRLVTQPNGTILDPFMGSGSTGKAAMLEGFKFIGYEMEPEYLQIAESRIKSAYNEWLTTNKF